MEINSFCKRKACIVYSAYEAPCDPRNPDSVERGKIKVKTLLCEKF